MNWLRLCFFLIVVTAITACSPHKRTLAEARSLSEAGLQKDAFDRYLAVYQQDPRKTEALIGLRETSRSLVNRYYSEVQMLKGQENYLRALDALADADNFVNQYRWLDLQRPFFADNLREEIHKALGRQNYQLAEDAVRRERWEEATSFLNTARRYDRNMEEIVYLERMIRILPDYRKGEKAMELGLWQEAYVFFERVSQIDADFGNVLGLMDECVERARITATTIHITRSNEPTATDRSIMTSVKENILDLKNPFVRLVVRDDLDYLLDEQRASMSGAFDESAVVEAGRLIGANYVILGELLRFDLKTEIISETRQKAYAGRNILARKVEYVERRSRQSLDAVYRYYLVRTETGEVVAAENIPFYSEEELHWAEYNGDHTSLHPGNWNQVGLPSLQDRVYLDQKHLLDRLMNAPRQHSLGNTKEQEFIRLVGEEVAERINAYALERRVGS